ncbi:hypothetical protein FAD_1376 [Ferroplasma acidiphilum]|uniref:Cation-transporting P-type ATPase N-terminal domain-containing protein n=1 Tax=Ferroplasma acidiphilum TaxID=74969 RepID=A0A1V0N553_9ARCH|nr:cation-transporting P-type ATPase [Ferroplasma acidiphilum]ARD85237.1 hypothetical protein FAD_1376 [Ferroplasma acidiphilum]MCL4349430.1 cation-transporting P-type ATPase [Candidatus Thermoplasmatota archaeon]
MGKETFNHEIEDVENILKSLGVDVENGLTESEATRRIQSYGLNAIPEAKKHGILQIFLDQLKEPLILVLVVIGIIYFLIGTPFESFTVIIIVFAVILIEVYNVKKAQISIQALHSMVTPKTWVLRNGSLLEKSTSVLVPGDIVYLRTGDMVPADGIVVSSSGLYIDESLVTGESYPVNKVSYDVAETQPGANMHRVVSGTLVVQGNGKFAVTSTGLKTEIGKISESVKNHKEIPTPLEKSLNKTARLLIVIAVFFSALIPLIGYVHGDPLDQMILMGLSMAFATVPEEIPILITITLAIGAYSLSKKKAIVKGLTAAQTLGSVTVIATDKTGTITENAMKVNHILTGGKLYEAAQGTNSSFLKSAVLATGNLEIEQKFSEGYKDPMEVAILKYAINSGLDIHELESEYQITGRFGFDSNIKRASYVYSVHDGYVAYTSGAPEVVLSRCTKVMVDESSNKVKSEDDLKLIRDAINEVAKVGERTIAFAYKRINGQAEERDIVDSDMIFIGMISFIDPPGKGVKNAVKLCQNAGIRVIMLTGDYPVTAETIGKMVGIENAESTLTGDQIRAMPDDELSKAIEKTSIFARITHDQKLRIVKALQKNGEIVAVTGDGANDASALRAAEIGISMGKRGTEVAKEASDIVLEDDNFHTIAEAVFEGRKMQYTLKKGIRYYIAVKISLILILLVPILLIIPFPFMPIQIIIMEMFMDVGALWGFLKERDEPGILHAAPQKRGADFMDRPMIISILTSALGVFLAVTFIYLYIYYSEADIIQAQTAAFATWILSQVILAQNLRTEREPVSQRSFFSNWVILSWGLIVVGALIVITIFTPLHAIIDTSTIEYRNWVLIIIVSVLSSSWIELRKIIISKKKKNPPQPLQQ